MEGSKVLESILNHLNMRPKAFSDAIGNEKPQAIYDIQKGKTKNISESMAIKIISVFPEFNKSWLMSGDGEMLKTESYSNTGEMQNVDISYFTNYENKQEPQNGVFDTELEYYTARAKGIKLLPEVDFKFTGGKMELIGGSDTVKRYWHLPDCKDCEAIAQVAGNSMAPEYPSGCWVALKKVGFDVERSTEISFGNVFGIVLEDPITGDYHGHIKILRRYKDPAMARKYWIARSVDQDNYDDFDIDITKVRGLWIVKQHVVSDVFL